MMHVAVLGCGSAGAGWVEVFAAAGHKVTVWDPVAAAVDGIGTRHGARVSIASTAEAAVSSADFVQESVPEDRSTKRAVFRSLAAVLPDHALVASSTATLLATDLQRGLPFASRFVVGHPCNPLSVLPLVEVVGGEGTAPQTVDAAVAFYARSGRRPLQLRSERAGHLVNRLQAALWREAVDAVVSGQATVEEVDLAVTQALGPRWSLTGPFGTFDLMGAEGGLARFLDRFGGAFEDLWDDARRPDVTAEVGRSLIEATRRSTPGKPIRLRLAERDAKLRTIVAVAGRS